MYNVLKNSIKPNLLQRTAIALSRADQLTAAREYRLHGRVLYSQGGLDAARLYRTRYFKSPGPVRAGTGARGMHKSVTSIICRFGYSSLWIEMKHLWGLNE